MRALIRVLGVPALAGVCALMSCGGQAGPPQFVQSFGAVDSPCAVQAPPSNAVQHCVAHVVLENQGGQGYGHLTIAVQLKAARAGSAPVPPVLCGSSIPNTPGGGHADLVCPFDLPAGDSVTTYPIVQSIDFVGPTSGGSSDNGLSSLATLILTVATSLVALASLIVVTSVRRRTPAREPEEISPTPRDEATAERRPSKAADPDSEYNLPHLPR